MARILQVCNSDFYLDTFLKPLVFGLQDRGHSVECICNGRDFSPEFSRRGIRIHQGYFPAKAAPWEFISSIRSLQKFLAENKFDCIDSHNRNASIVARVAAWRASDAINLYTAHGMYFHDGQNKTSNYLTEVLEGFLARVTTFTFSQSGEDTDRMIRHQRIPADKILTIGNGINTEKFDPTKARGQSAVVASKAIFRIAALGRLVSGKGFEDLLRAFHEFQNMIPHSELLIIGGNVDTDFDSSDASIRELIDKLGLAKKVRVTGMVNNVDEYLATADVFVHPSYREGMPRSLLEAMCMGLPVLATAIRGAREIIKDGENGFLFQPRDSHRISELLHLVYSLPDSERRAMGSRARLLILKEFDEKDYVKRQIAAIEGLLQSRNPAGPVGTGK